MTWACVLLVVGYETLFLVAPLQVAYLLPLLPGVLLLAGIAWRARPAVLVALLIAGASSAIVSVNVIHVTGSVHRVESALAPLVAFSGPTIHGRSTTVSAGLFVRWGYLVTDVVARQKSISASSRPAAIAPLSPGATASRRD